MSRVEIKEKAKEMIKDNLLTLWKPMLIILGISFGIAFVLSFIVFMVFNTETANIITSIIGSLLSIVLLPAIVGVCVYYLKFVRGEELSFDLLKK